MNNVNIIALVALVSLTQAQPVNGPNILRRGQYLRPTPVSVKKPAYGAYSSPSYDFKGSAGHAQGYGTSVSSKVVNDEDASQDIDSQPKGSVGKSAEQSSLPDGGKQVNQGPVQDIQKVDDSNQGPDSDSNNLKDTDVHFDGDGSNSNRKTFGEIAKGGASPSVKLPKGDGSNSNHKASNEIAEGGASPSVKLPEGDGSNSNRKASNEIAEGGASPSVKLPGANLEGVPDNQTHQNDGLEEGQTQQGTQNSGSAFNSGGQTEVEEQHKTVGSDTTGNKKSHNEPIQLFNGFETDSVASYKSPSTSGFGYKSPKTKPVKYMRPSAESGGYKHPKTKPVEYKRPSAENAGYKRAVPNTVKTKHPTSENVRYNHL